MPANRLFRGASLHMRRSPAVPAPQLPGAAAPDVPKRPTAGAVRRLRASSRGRSRRPAALTGVTGRLRATALRGPPPGGGRGPPAAAPQYNGGPPARGGPPPAYADARTQQPAWQQQRR